jgi:alpha-amylase
MPELKPTHNSATRPFVENFVKLFLSYVLCGVLLACVTGRLIAQNASNEFWQAQSIYQIITDRFFDGDSSNNNLDGNYNPASSSGSSVHGGDFKGIEKKLDYIKSLGATAIWISPVVVNVNGEFHGYAGRDFYNVDPHWGTLGDLQHMIQAAHARGLLVIDDIIVNHGGDLVYSTDSGYSTFVAPPGGYNLRYRNSKQFAFPFNTNAANPFLTNLFHNNGAINNYNDNTQVTLGELSGLDDFRTETDYIRTNMAAVYEFWIAQGFDAFRIDTVKHVEMGFWQNWCPNIHAYATSIGKPNFFTFGECLDGSESKVGSYTGTKSGGPFALDAMLDYPLYFTLNSVFATASGNTQQLENHYNNITNNYDPSAYMRLVTFLDNHDQPRFLNASGANLTRLQVALSFLYSSRGIPCLYYGTEQGFSGSTDPNDREDMFAGQFEPDAPSVGDNFNMTHATFLHVAKMNNFRRLYPALQTGAHVNKWYNPSGPGLFAYARRLGTQEVFVVFNTASSTQTLTNRSTSFTAGTKLLNLFDTNEVVTVTSTPEIPSIVVPSMSSKIFVAQSAWRPLDPVVVGNSPAHDAASAPTYSPVILQFNEPMDTNSVQSAFNSTPALTGSFSWSSNRDTMTFLPADPGLPALTLITVRLTNSAIGAVSGNHLYASYEMRFKTAATSFQDSVRPVIALQSPSNSASLSGLVNISGTSSDNIAVQKVEVRLDQGEWLAANGTTSWSLALNSSNFLNGPHALSARATDTSGNFSTTNTVNVLFINVPGAYLQRLSAGNPNNVINCDSAVWQRESQYAVGSFGYSGGATGYVANSIGGVCAQAQSLYQRERYSTSSAGFFFQFDCPAGIYETTLLEAETYWAAAGKRIFNVFIQDAEVATNVDIFAAAGGANLPLSLVFTNAVTNSQLKVLFTPVVDNARLSGIQVKKIDDVFSDSDGIPDWWRLAYFGHALGQAADKSRSSDDADGDGVSNLSEFLSGTVPIDPGSLFKITSAAIVGEQMQVICTSETGRFYQLQQRDNLITAGAWLDVGPETGGTGTAITLNGDPGVTNSESYFRVRVR